MNPLYPIGLEAEGTAAEHGVRLERARHRALLAEARRARPSRGSRPSSRPYIVTALRRATAATLRAASAVLAALADVVERPLLGHGLERVG
jgi:hypothetical protein